MQRYPDAKLKHTQRREIKDVDADLFETYKEYLLGDYCYGLRTAESAGATIPPWTLVLEGLQLGAALKKSWKDASVKERHFITPLPPPPGNWDNANRGRGRGRGKGGKGNKGSGNGKATATAQGSSRAPDEKPICFRYNSKAGCKKKDKCHFAHVCFAKHPAYQCKASAKDTQGEGAA